MRLSSSLAFLVVLHLGCSPASTSAGSQPGPGAEAAAGADGAVAAAAGIDRAGPVGGPPAPAFGPGAGAVFHEDEMIAVPGGGVQLLGSWGAMDAAGARAATCADETVQLAEGVAYVYCTREPKGGAKLGWTKVEITGKTGAAWAFRYVHWPLEGGAELTGTGVWTPNGEKSTLTYTHGVDVTGSEGKPIPGGPALTEPEPNGPALTEPEPKGPALTEPEPKGPALTEPEPTGGNPSGGNGPADGYVSPPEGEPPPEDKPSPPPSDEPPSDPSPSPPPGEAAAPQ
jgi:hypothetical protein